MPCWENPRRTWSLVLLKCLPHQTCLPQTGWGRPQECLSITSKPSSTIVAVYEKDRCRNEGKHPCQVNREGLMFAGIPNTQHWSLHVSSPSLTVSATENWLQSEQFLGSSPAFPALENCYSSFFLWNNQTGGDVLNTWMCQYFESHPDSSLALNVFVFCFRLNL